MRRAGEPEPRVGLGIISVNVKNQKKIDFNSLKTNLK